MIPVLLGEPRSLTFLLRPFTRAAPIEALLPSWRSRRRLPLLALPASRFESAALRRLGLSANQRAPAKGTPLGHAPRGTSSTLHHHQPRDHLGSRCATSSLLPPFWSSYSRAMATSGKIDLRSPSTNWKEAKKFLKDLDLKKRREHYGVKDFVPLKELPPWKDLAKKLKIKQCEDIKFPKHKEINEKMSIFKGDITKLEVDAIVNAANKSLLGGGGVDGCIHEAAGPLLKLECNTLQGCETGKAKITCGYLLPAKCVIHTVGPVARGKPEPSDEEELKNCYENSLTLAVENKLRSVAFPCIATGIYGYPSEDAADVALRTIRLFLEENTDKFDRIVICAFMKKDEDIYLQRFPQYFPVA